MSNALLRLNCDHDIFSAYDCSKNDSEQKRFMAVLNEVRRTCTEKGVAEDGDTGIPDPKFYLAVITGLIVQRLSAQNQVGLPELLRLLHIAMQSAPLDSHVAGELADKLIPILESKETAQNSVLLPPLLQVTANLSRRTRFTDTQEEVLISAVCEAALNEKSKVRNTASKAIYDNPNLHQRCLERLFQTCDQSPIRALTVLKNIASSAKPNDWKKNAESILQYCESDNRAVRVKAFELMSHCLHHLPPETVIAIVDQFTRNKPEAPGDVLIAMAQLLQSAITMLAREAPASLVENFPRFLHQMISFLTIQDDEAQQIISQTILYAIAAITSNAGEAQDFARLAPVVSELNSSLTIQYMTVWPQVYSILSTLPPQLHEHTYELLSDPIIASLQKLTADLDSHHRDVIVSFIATCMNEMGIGQFFESTGFTLDSDDAYKYVAIPVLTQYSSKKNVTDLQFTEEIILPFEADVYQRVFPDEDIDRNTDEWVSNHLLWVNLWNALPQCVTSKEGEMMPEFVELCCMRFDAHRDLIRPISKIFFNVAKFIAGMHEPLLKLINACVDASTASCAIPAISAICAAKPSDDLNSFFQSVAKDCLQKALDPDQITNACALVDVILAMCPYISDQNRKLFYDMMIRFIKKQGPFQKRALRAIRDLIKKYHFEGTVNELKEVLASTQDRPTSSTIRYRILLMTTLLEIATDEYAELLTEFLPEIVAAVKDQGEKTRAAAEEALITIGQFQSEGMQSVDSLVAAVCTGFAQDSSSYVASSMEALAIIMQRFFAKCSNEVTNNACEAVWAASQVQQTSEVARSALSFARVLLNRVPKLVEENQLESVLSLAVMCTKRSNWEISNSGKYLIEKCIEKFGIDPVTAKFPKDELKLLRGARKEQNRKTRAAEKAKGDEKENASSDDGIELDDRDHERELDLLDSANVISKKAVKRDDDEDENLEFDEHGRIVMKEAPKARKGRQTKEEDEDEDDFDHGNEVDELMDKRRAKLMKKREQQRAVFLNETGNKFRAPRGKGDQMKKGGQVPFAQAALNSKSVNKRFRGQMKAQYKELFKKK